MNNIFDWIASRKRDNFSYTKGSNVGYSLDCKNSLVVSDENLGYIEGKSNYAIIKVRGKKKLILISEIERILNEISPILSGKNILYRKPRSIHERENLNQKCIKEIKENIIRFYGIDIKEILEIQNSKGSSRIYKINSKKDEKFIFKYRGKDINLFEAQTRFLDKINYFSKIIPALNSDSNINFKGEIYALEEFFGGGRFLGPKQKYFKLVGKHIALMHNQINLFSKKNKLLENLLLQGGNFLSESNLVSMKIDLDNESRKRGIFLKETYKLFGENLGERLNSLPRQIIHGDLNRSNLIWKGEDVKMIDPENLKFSRRIEEFIPPLLFKGNFQNPAYTSNSIKELLFSYDLFSENKLTQEEKEIFPNLLSTSLIKLYTIYTLRRNKRDELFRNQIIRDLKILREDLNVY